MHIDHILSFNTACDSVVRLATDAIAEHRRQIETIEKLGREAAELAARVATGRIPPEAPAPLPAGREEPPAAGQPPHNEGAPADDILATAMRRVEAEERHSGAQELRDRSNGIRLFTAPILSEDDSATSPVFARGRDLVASLAGKKRLKRPAAG